MYHPVETKAVLGSAWSMSNCLFSPTTGISIRIALDSTPQRRRNNASFPSASGLAD